MEVDLNADVGESFGRWVLGEDAGVMPHISSANVACGYHAGDPGSMRAAVVMARDAGVAIGAHPGLPDLAGFGRRRMELSPREVEDLVLYQVGALAGVAAAEGVRLRHVKPHGALYHMAAADPELAAAIARAIRVFDRSLILVGPPESALAHAAESAGVQAAAEGFADRAYERDGSLVPRGRPGAVLQGTEVIVERAIRMVREGTVRASDGSLLPVRVQTICIHGDTPGAADLSRHLRAGLEAAGIAVRPLPGFNAQ